MSDQKSAEIMSPGSRAVWAAAFAAAIRDNVEPKFAAVHARVTVERMQQVSADANIDAATRAMLDQMRT